MQDFSELIKCSKKGDKVTKLVSEPFPLNQPFVEFRTRCKHLFKLARKNNTPWIFTL